MYEEHLVKKENTAYCHPPADHLWNVMIVFRQHRYYYSFQAGMVEEAVIRLKKRLKMSGEEFEVAINEKGILRWQIWDRRLKQGKPVMRVI